MARQNRILAGLLVLQIVVGAIVFWPRPAAGGGEGQALFPAVTADAIVGLTITDAGDKSIHLVKRDGKWVLPDADDYPCDGEKVTSLLTKIVGLKTNRPVTQTSASHKQLKVADSEFERLIEFELSDGTRHRLFLGTSPSYGASHIRAGGQDPVYLAGELSTFDVTAQALTWVDPVFFQVPAEQVVALVLENSSGRVEFVKGQDGNWTLQDLAPGETADATAIQSLINRATSISMVRPLGKEGQESYGLQQPAATITIHTSSDEGEKTYTLRIGAQDPEDKSYVLASSTSPYLIRISEYTGRDWVEKTREDFLELPPTATPPSTTMP